MNKEITKHIEAQLKELNLKGMLACYRDIAEKAAVNKLSYEEYLSLLLEEEIKGRNERSIKAKIYKARVPFVKTLEGFDFSFQPDLREKELMRLSSLDFIENKENLVFLGPPGVGKTHLAVGFCIKACQAKYRVLFMSTQKLIEDLMMCVRDGSLTKRLLYYSRLHLLVIDEIGYMPITKEQANLLYQLISMRYEKGSIILTSNYSFEEWGKVFQDDVVAAAIIDRIVHHARIFYINGASYRLKNKLKNKSLQG